MKPLIHLETKPDSLKAIASDFVLSLPPADSYDKLACIELAGVSVCSVVSVLVQKPFFIMRKESKGYGTKKLVEGVVESGDRVVLIVDSIEGLQSHIKSVLDETGAELTAVIGFNSGKPVKLTPEHILSQV